jgi:hypothetical protein
MFFVSRDRFLFLLPCAIASSNSTRRSRCTASCVNKNGLILVQDIPLCLNYNVEMKPSMYSWQGKSQVRFPVVSLEYFIDISFRPHYGPGDDSASNRNEYQEYFLRGKGGQFLGLTTLPPSCADCIEIWEPQPPGTLLAYPGL